VAVEGYAEEAFVRLEHLPDLAAPAPAPREPVALLPFQDNLVALRGGPALLCDPAHHAREIPVWGAARGETLGEAKYVALRSLVVGDRVAGFWEYDPDEGSVVYATFDPLTSQARRAV